MSENSDTLLDFPCDFPIKAMGRSDGELQSVVAEIISRHVPDISKEAFSTAASRRGRFVSITVNVRATSKEQLDRIYQDLTDSEHVLMAL